MNPSVDIATLALVLINLLGSAYVAGGIREQIREHERRLKILEELSPRQPKRSTDI